MRPWEGLNNNLERYKRFLSLLISHFVCSTLEEEGMVRLKTFEFQSEEEHKELFFTIFPSSFLVTKGRGKHHDSQSFIPYFGI